MSLIVKMLPVNVYDIAQTQSYLSDMASKGYFLKKLSAFAHFEKGKPEEITYRLEPLMRDETKPQEEQLTYYESCGWEYVCTVKEAFHIYKTNKKDNIEIHTDPIADSYAFKYLNKKLKRSYFKPIVALLLLAALLYLTGSFDSYSLLFDVRLGSVDMMYTIMVLLLIFFTIKQVIDNRKKIKLITKKLKKGSEIPQKSSYRNNYNHYIFNTITICFVLFTMIGTFYMHATRWEKNISEYNNPIPTIQLADIETAQNFKIDNDYYMINQISYKSTELASAIYEINERGIVKGQMSKGDQSREYSPSLSTNFYRLRFGFLREPFLKELIDYELETLRFEQIDYQEILDTDFDEAIFAKYDGIQMFFGVLDKDVIHIRYYGYEDLTEHFEEIYDKVRNFQ